MALGDRMGFVGAGQMAEAFIGGLLKSRLCRPEQVRATDPSAARRELMRERFGIETGVDNAAMAAWADVVVLAVKPQLCESVVSGIQASLTSQLVLSIAAGIRLDWLRDRMPSGVRLIRIMPNAPALVGAGMSAVAASPDATSADTAFALRLCRAVGQAELIDEALMDAVTGLSGSGPAFVFVALEAMADGGVLAGLPRELAQRLAVASALGTAQMVSAADRPGVSSVSQGEPTQAGLEVVRAGEMERAVSHAVYRAAQRSKELGA